MTLERNEVYCMDALELLGNLEDGSVDLIVTDPPYNIGKAAWDIWETPASFLAWLDEHLREMRRVLKPNGSLYLFADTRFAAQVELTVGIHLHVLNSITWVKREGWHNKASKDNIRGYFPQTERVIFAEQYGADMDYTDAIVDGERTYWDALERVKVGVFGAYLKREFQAAGVSNREIAALFPSRTGGLTGCVSNWLLGLNIPTAEQYHTMRQYLNERGGDYLRREYDELRREYDELRRPFFASDARPYTDVWEYKTVNTYPGKHPCEKPLDMLMDIITTSSRAGALVLDCFAGSGATLHAARNLGRDYIGGDMDAYWVGRAQERLRLPFEPRRVQRDSDLSGLPMFEAVRP